ncbi:MAG TPA: DUF3343 domain-containing protein [Peptostreptococcaceae bacterium]|nr:DUF3343 domain-containing protein [Peptostreptococcaceae bacterium]
MNCMYIVSFDSTHHAIRSEKIFIENNIKVSTLPTPREISSSCGISVRFLEEDLKNIKSLLESNEVLYNGIYEVKRLENGKKEIKKID